MKTHFFWPARLYLLATAAVLYAENQAESPLSDESRFVKAIVKEGQSFSTLMRVAGIPYREILDAVVLMRSQFDLERLRPGQVLYYKKSRQASPVLEELRVDLGSTEARLFFKERRSLITGKEIRAKTVFNKSAAALFKEENPQAYGQLLELFSFQIDHTRGIKDEDAVVLFYQRYEDEYGNFVKNGPLQYAALDTGKKTYSAYAFNGAYYNGQARPLKENFIAMPLEAWRITGHYGWRRHPIRRRREFHPALDVRAPLGTAVAAAADGTVSDMSQNKWLGTQLIIQHKNGFSTIYGHLSAYAENLRIGSKVKQGDIVAQSGNSGVSTGPHLHFGVMQGKNPVHPASVLPQACTPLLSQAEEPAFFLEKKAIDALLKASRKK